MKALCLASGREIPVEHLIERYQGYPACKCAKTCKKKKNVEQWLYGTEGGKHKYLSLCHFVHKTLIWNGPESKLALRGGEAGN